MSSTSLSSTGVRTKGSDEFTSGVTSFFDVIAKQKALLVVLGVFILIAAVTMAVIANHREKRSDEGRNALYLAQKSLDTQLEAIAKATAPAVVPEAPAATKDAAKPKKAPPPVTADSILFQKINVDSQLGDSVTKLKAVATDFASTLPGFEATLVLAKLYLTHGEPAEASEWFQKATTIAPTSLDKGLAWENLGYARENEGKEKEAVDAFQSALDVGEPVLKGDLLLSKARGYEALHDTDKAKASYDQILAQLPNTDYAKTAELFKSRLK